MESFYCVNCDSIVHLDVRGRCPSCGSDAVVPREAENLQTRVIQHRQHRAVSVLYRSRCHLAAPSREMTAGDRAAWLLLHDLSWWILSGRKPSTLGVSHGIEVRASDAGSFAAVV